MWGHTVPVVTYSTLRFRKSGCRSQTDVQNIHTYSKSVPPRHVQNHKNRLGDTRLRKHKGSSSHMFRVTQRGSHLHKRAIKSRDPHAQMTGTRPYFTSSLTDSQLRNGHLTRLYGGHSRTFRCPHLLAASPSPGQPHPPGLIPDAVSFTTSPPAAQAQHRKEEPQTAQRPLGNVVRAPRKGLWASSQNVQVSPHRRPKETSLCYSLGQFISDPDRAEPAQPKLSSPHVVGGPFHSFAAPRWLLEVAG